MIWMCPKCGTRYVSNVGNCGNLIDCTRPKVIRMLVGSRKPVKAELEYGQSLAKTQSYPLPKEGK